MQIDITTSQRRAGFQGELYKTATSLGDRLPDELFSGQVRQILGELAAEHLLIVIIDEFDRIRSSDTRKMLADTLKMLSDHRVSCTLVLVGVADTVEELISEHESVERALVQIPMPRMSPEELKEITEKGLSELGMTIDQSVKVRIANLSRGLPHYTHLLAKHSARSALDDGKLNVGARHLDQAIEKALAEAQQSIRSAYHRATTSAQKDNLYTQVLLACAIAPTDEMGFFAPVDVREPMSRIMGDFFDIPRFQRHLNDFVTSKRGDVLQRQGGAHRWRYRFTNPLMQPYVVLQGHHTGLLGDAE